MPHQQQHPEQPIASIRNTLNPTTAAAVPAAALTTSTSTAHGTSRKTGSGTEDRSAAGWTPRISELTLPSVPPTSYRSTTSHTLPRILHSSGSDPDVYRRGSSLHRDDSRVDSISTQSTQPPSLTTSSRPSAAETVPTSPPTAPASRTAPTSSQTQHSHPPQHISSAFDQINPFSRRTISPATSTNRVSPPSPPTFHTTTNTTTSPEINSRRVGQPAQAPTTIASATTATRSSFSTEVDEEAVTTPSSPASLAGKKRRMADLLLPVDGEEDAGGVSTSKQKQDTRTVPGPVPIPEPPPPLPHPQHHPVHQLVVRQQPLRARMCGFGEKDRRPLDPPPILQLIITSTQTGRTDPDALSDPFFVVHATLWSDTGEEERNLILTNKDDSEQGQERGGREEKDAGPAGSVVKVLIGSLVSSPALLEDDHGVEGVYFAFPDLSIRTEGRYRLKFSLVRLGTGDFDGSSRSTIVAEGVSDVFTVYSAKKFPGMTESTELTKAFARQGLKIPIRNDVRGKNRGKTTSNMPPPGAEVTEEHMKAKKAKKHSMEA